MSSGCHRSYKQSKRVEKGCLALAPLIISTERAGETNTPVQSTDRFASIFVSITLHFDLIDAVDLFSKFGTFGIGTFLWV